MGILSKPSDWLWSVAIKKAAERVARSAVGLLLGVLTSTTVQPVLDRLGVDVNVDVEKTAAALSLIIYGAIEAGWNRWKHKDKMEMKPVVSP